MHKLSKLKKLTYRKQSKAVHSWATRHLDQLPLSNSLSEICFDMDLEAQIGLDLDKEPERQEWGQIDSVLVGEKFRSLRTVLIGPDDFFDYMSLLHTKGILKKYY